VALTPVTVRDTLFDFSTQRVSYAVAWFTPRGGYRLDSADDITYAPVAVGPIQADDGVIVTTLVTTTNVDDDPIVYDVTIDLAGAPKVEYQVTLPAIDPDIEGLVLNLADRDRQTGVLALPDDAPGSGGTFPTTF
jgi:hypothetical protein